MTTGSPTYIVPLDGSTLENTTTGLSINLSNANTWTGNQTFPSSSIANSVLEGPLVTSITAGTGISVSNPSGVGAATVNASAVPNSALSGALVDSLTTESGGGITLTATNPTGVGAAYYTPSVSIGGDLSGSSLSSVTVAKINGQTISYTSLAAGAILYYNGTDWVNLAIGSSGQVLTVSSGEPAWEAVSNAVTSVSNSDGTLTISPTTGAVVASLALGHANTWTATQTFPSASIANSVLAGALVDSLTTESGGGITLTATNPSGVGAAYYTPSVTLGGDVSGSSLSSITVAKINGETVSYTSLAAGAILYYNGTDWVNLAIGSSGQVLTVSSGEPSWETAASGGVTSVSNSDGTLTISPTTGAVVASLNLANSNTWTAVQIFENATIPASGTATSTTSYNSYTLGFNSSYWNGSAAATYTCSILLQSNNYLVINGSNVQLQATGSATSTNTTVPSYVLTMGAEYWNGSASVEVFPTIYANADTAGHSYLVLNSTYVNASTIIMSNSLYLPNNNNTKDYFLYLAGTDTAHYIQSTGTDGDTTIFGEYGSWAWYNTNSSSNVMTLSSTGVLVVNTINANENDQVGSTGGDEIIALWGGLQSFPTSTNTGMYGFGISGNTVETYTNENFNVWQLGFSVSTPAFSIGGTSNGTGTQFLVKTANNTLDNGSGDMTINGVATFTNAPTMSGQTALNWGPNGTIGMSAVQYSNRFAFVPIGSSADSNLFTVENTSFDYLFYVNCSTNATYTYHNTLDNGSGNMSIAGNVDLAANKGVIVSSGSAGSSTVLQGGKANFSNDTYSYLDNYLNVHGFLNGTAESNYLGFFDLDTTSTPLAVAISNESEGANSSYVVSSGSFHSTSDGRTKVNATPTTVDMNAFRNIQVVDFSEIHPINRKGNRDDKTEEYYIDETTTVPLPTGSRTSVKAETLPSTIGKKTRDGIYTFDVGGLASHLVAVVQDIDRRLQAIEKKLPP